MKAADRIDGLLEDLDSSLNQAATLVDRGRSAYDSDIAMRLALEALSNRVGEVAKQLLALDPARFVEPDWSFAARNRDKVVHHYSSIDNELLWATVSLHFPALRGLVDAKRGA